MNHFFRSRRTKPPTYTEPNMCPDLWGGNSSFAGQYVYSHILNPNSPPPLYCLPPPLFSLILRPGAETAQLMHTHTPCNAIVIFRLDAFRDHFAPCAPKQGPKIEVDEKRIFC